MAKKSKKVSEAQDLVEMCDDALLRKIGMENIKFSKMAMEELVRREQKKYIQVENGRPTGRLNANTSRVRVKSSIYLKKSVQSYPDGQMRRALNQVIQNGI